MPYHCARRQEVCLLNAAVVLLGVIQACPAYEAGTQVVQRSEGSQKTFMRVAAIPGDWVMVVDGTVHVNGAEVARTGAEQRSAEVETWEVRVPDCHVLVVAPATERGRAEFGVLPTERLDRSSIPAPLPLSARIVRRDAGSQIEVTNHSTRTVRAWLLKPRGPVEGLPNSVLLSPETLWSGAPVEGNTRTSGLNPTRTFAYGTLPVSAADADMDVAAVAYDDGSVDGGEHEQRNLLAAIHARGFEWERVATVVRSALARPSVRSVADAMRRLREMPTETAPCSSCRSMADALADLLSDDTLDTSRLARLADHASTLTRAHAAFARR